MPNVNKRPPVLFTTRKSAEKGRPIVRVWFENIIRAMAEIEDQEDNPHLDHEELKTVS